MSLGFNITRSIPVSTFQVSKSGPFSRCQGGDATSNEACIVFDLINHSSEKCSSLRRRQRRGEASARSTSGYQEALQQCAVAVVVASAAAPRLKRQVYADEASSSRTSSKSCMESREATVVCCQLRTNAQPVRESSIFDDSEFVPPSAQVIIGY